ncbi:MAG: NifU family protein [Candidatus Hydrogenedentes bacterium]|nr:NifU family protein [Candidatus Hydrogenedentota bacterium]
MHSAALTKPAATPAPVRRPNPILAELDEKETPPLVTRKIIQPTVLVEEQERSGWTDEVRIKARVERDQRSCVFLVDRPLLDGHSAYFPNPASCQDSPLAQAIFEIPEVETVLLHGTNVTVTRSPMIRESWEPMAREIGAVVRDHLKNHRPAVAEPFLANMPSEEEIREKLARIIDLEINPGIAAHSGMISLERVEGNTVYIKMMGGCQGCAASAITLRQGIHLAFRQIIPQIGAILDVTDHAAGKNPYFTELPAGMQRYA